MKKIMSIVALCGLVSLTACHKTPKVEQGDTVMIDFAGFVDGVQFPGGTAQNYPLQVGSGQFIPGFEDQLIGVKEGGELDVKVTFPADYAMAPDLAGKEAVFKVKVVAILEK